MAVLTKKSFLNESVSTNQTITTIDFYSKIYNVNTTAAGVTITLPFAGGGAPTGSTILAANNAGANNLTVTYQSGVSIILPPDGYAFLIFDGVKWELSDNSVQRTLTSYLQISGTTGVKLTGDTTKLNIRNSANTEYRDLQVRSVLSGLLNDIDTGTSFVRTHAEDGGVELLSNAEEAAGAYTRKYANSAFRIKHDALTGHLVYLDVAADGAAGSSIPSWSNILQFNCATGKISAIAEITGALTISGATTINNTLKSKTHYLLTTALEIAGYMSITDLGGINITSNNDGAGNYKTTNYSWNVTLAASTGIFSLQGATGTAGTAISQVDRLLIDLPNSNFDISSTLKLRVLNTTASTSTTTGALVVTGGAGIDGALYVGGTVRFTNTTASTSTTTGALVVTGGLGVGDAINGGSTLTIAGLATLNGGLSITGTVSGSIATSTPTAANVVGTNITSVSFTNLSLIKINNFYVLSFGFTGTVTTTGILTSVVFNLSPTLGNINLVGGAANGYGSDNKDQSFTVQRTGTDKIIAHTPSINIASGATVTVTGMVLIPV